MIRRTMVLAVMKVISVVTGGRCGGMWIMMNCLIVMVVVIAVVVVVLLTLFLILESDFKRRD